MSEETKLSPMFAVIELMGHIKYAGKLTEEEHFGSKLGWIDVFKGDGFQTIYFGGASVYRITPCSEQVARDVARRCQSAPVSFYDYPPDVQEALSRARLPSPITSQGQGPDDDDDTDDDDGDDDDCFDRDVQF